MSKVICDVCGTAFPETATQCPICGSAKAPSAQAEQQTTAYTYVKGGRFSKSNVRKRNSAKAASSQRRAPSDRQSPRRSSGSSGEENANRALIVVVVLLLLAIVAVVVYIGVRLVGPADTPDDGGKPGQTQSTEKPDPGPSEIPCTSLQTTQTIELSKVGETWDIQVSKLPENTTDSVIFESADPTIATVDTTNGKVTAVAAGETTVIVKCGSKTSTCKVIVSDGGAIDPDDPDDPDDPVNPDFVLALRKEDVSFSRYGETWNAYDGSVSAEEITWISDDPTICTVENGKVTAVGPGQTKIYAQYGDQTVECIIRCKDTVVKPDTDPNVKISTEDVTLTIGKDDSFTLTLKKTAEGQTDTLLNVTWTASEDGIVTIDGNKITGVSAGQVTVSAVYEGKTYKCIVRVKAAE